jgi:hypothetical protein
MKLWFARNSGDSSTALIKKFNFSLNNFTAFKGADNPTD